MPLTSPPQKTLLSGLKIMLWEEAKQWPLYAELKKPDNYGFQIVNKQGELRMGSQTLPLPALSVHFRPDPAVRAAPFRC